MIGPVYVLASSSHHNRPARINEPVAFYAAVNTVSGARILFDCQIRYKLIRNSSDVIQEGTFETRRYTNCVRFSSPVPGAFRCEFTGYRDGAKIGSASIGVLVAPELIQPALPVPDDFDAFWAKELAKLAAIPVAPVLTEQEVTPEVSVFDVQAPCVDNVPVSGTLARPTARGKYPAILMFHGAGVRTSSDGRHIYFADKGFLALSINAHGLENGHDPEWYMDVDANRLSGYRREGYNTGDPLAVYMKNLYLRIVRAADVIRTLPDWDGKNLWVWGGSQGGMQSIVGAALIPQITGMAAWVPAGCDMYNGGWPFNELATTKEEAKLTAYRKTMPYFDCTSFATRVRDIPILWEIGLIDQTCKADGVMAAYNGMKSSQKHINYHYQMGHETTPDLIMSLEQFILQNLK